MTIPKRYVGMDVHQKYSEICELDSEGKVVDTARIPTTRSALARWFRGREMLSICLEAGGSSPWVDRQLREFGHDGLVCNPRRVRLIAESTLKNDKSMQRHWLAFCVWTQTSFTRSSIEARRRNVVEPCYEYEVHW